MRKFSTIYLDLDGPLSNFQAAAMVSHGRTEPTRENWPPGANLLQVLGITKEPGWHERFWEPINAVPDFWINVEPFPWVDYLIRSLNTFVGPHGLVICSSPAKSCCGTDIKQKMEWLAKYNINLEVKFEEEKSKLSLPGTLLIDDWEKQVDPFALGQGRAILFPQPWNRNHEYWRDPVKYVLESITSLAD